MNIGILGAGTWGIALARMLTRSKHAVTVWSALPDEIDELSRRRKQRNLPGMVVPDETLFTKSISEVCADKDIVMFAVPSVYVRSTAAAAAPYIKNGQLIVDVAKGLESETLLTMTQVIGNELSKHGDYSRVRLIALSGPTHAEEVARYLPTTIVSAGSDPDAAETVQDAFMNTCMRVYTQTDILGVELCGALKNIIALAAGISCGLGYGDNTRAAIITRGLAEIKRLGMKMGCAEQTFSGLAGMGDLIVTATSPHSRNNECGNLIGAGYEPDDAVRKVGMVVEGINALPAAMKLAEKYGVEMPIVSAVNEIVTNGREPSSAVYELMTRDKKSEEER